MNTDKYTDSWIPIRTVAQRLNCKSGKIKSLVRQGHLVASRGKIAAFSLNHFQAKVDAGELPNPSQPCSSLKAPKRKPKYNNLSGLLRFLRR